MKTTNRYTIKAERIRSLKDIEVEKHRLRLEIMKKEQDIHNSYRNILQGFSPRNLATSMVNDFTTSSSILSKAFSIGKAFMARRKKKKRDKAHDTEADPS
ncbi:MAG: hypothetical protein WCO44_14525 [Bacteroidota bacterium]